MDDRDHCIGCGEKRPADAPEGLCPACLLKAGLGSLHEVTVTLGPVPPGILESLAGSLGPIPHVLLRDTDPGVDPGPLVKPGSTEMPPSEGRSARLQLLGEIARGGMGAVLKGRDPDLGRDVAVKVLLESHRDNPDLIRRFVEEAQIGGQLQHPGIAPIYELGAFADRRPYFAMKLVKGRTLASLLAERPDPARESDLPRYLAIFESICQTMAYAHARGVIHRDLKPSNVMVGSFGEVQVMDWGLAKVMPQGGAADDASAGKLEAGGTVITTNRDQSDSDLSRAGSVLGTPSYMAPEQARGEIDLLDERCDVFALGSILCELLTGQPAFIGRSSGEIQRKAARADLNDAITRVKASHADPDLIELAEACLSPELEDRPRHAGEVAKRIDAYRTGVQERLRRAELARAEETARVEEATKRARVERHRLRLAVALAASVLGLITLGGGVAAWQVQLRQGRLAAVEATLARIQTLRDQAVGEGVGSNRRREALAAADQAVVSIGDLMKSEPGRRLVALREKLAEDQKQADLDKRLIDELAVVRTTVAKVSWDLDPSVIEGRFATRFKRYKIDVNITPVGEAVARLKSRPEAFVREVVGGLDHWLIFRYELKDKPDKTQGLQKLRRLLTLVRGLDSDPERNRLRALLEQEDLKSHLETLRAMKDEAKLFELGPSTPLLLSRSLKAAGDAEGAIAVLRKSVLRFPGDVWTNFELAELASGDEAVRYYTAVRALRPDTAWNLAQALEGQGKKVEAEELLWELSRIDPESLANLSSLFMLLKSSSRKDDAALQTLKKRMIGVVRARVRANPNDPLFHWELGALSFYLDEKAGVIAAYREAIRLDSKNDVCRNELGLLLLRFGDYQGAISAFREASCLVPSSYFYHEDLAVALIRSGDLGGEVAELREAKRCQNLVETQEATNSHGSQGELFAKDGCLGPMWEGYLFGLHSALVDNHSTLREKLGDALAESGDIVGAIVEYKEAIRLVEEKGKDQPSHDCYTRLADTRRMTGDLAGAITAYREAIRFDTDQQAEQARYGLCLSLAETGDLLRAIAEFRDATKLKQFNSTRFCLLRAVMMSQKPEDAIAALRRVHDQVRDDRPIAETINRTIDQFQHLRGLGTPIPKFVRNSSWSSSLPETHYRRRLFASSTAIWSAGFAADAPLADDMAAQDRYDAACSAALAGCGQGIDPPADEAARVKLRGQALEWLKADLASWSKRLDAGQPKDREEGRKTMQHWKRDADLAGVRDLEAQAKLSETERADWRTLWASVEALVMRSGATPP